MEDTTSVRDDELAPELESDAVSPPALDRTDQGIRLFLRIGVAALLLALTAFGVLYVRDQFAPKAPSIADQTIVKAEEAVRQQPNNVTARLALGAMYTEKQRYDEAVVQYREILRVDPVNQDAMIGAGDAEYRKGDLDAAVTFFTKVVNLKRSGEFAGADRRLQSAYYFLGVIAAKKGNLAEAQTNLSEALTITPSDSDARYEMGLVLARLGKHDEAVASLNQALQFVPTGWCEPYSALQTSYQALGKADNAAVSGAMGQFCNGKLAVAKQALQGLVGGSAGVDALLGLGLIAQTENDDAAATKYYQQVLVKDPQNVVALSYLAALAPSPSPSATPTK